MSRSGVVGLGVAGGDVLAVLLLDQLALPLGDAQRAGDVAGDVHAGAAHVEQPVHSHDQADIVHGDVQRGEHHRQHDHAGAGGSGGADGGQGGGDDDGHHLPKAQVHAGTGGQEDGGHALIDGGAVHVDGGAQRKHEGGHVLIGTHLVSALLGDRDGGGRGGGAEGEHHGRGSTLEKPQGADSGKDPKDRQNASQQKW